MCIFTANPHTMHVKRFVFPVAITLGAIAIFGTTGCSKSSNNNNTGSGTISCTVNGAAFAAQPYQVAAGYLAAYGQMYVVGYNIQNRDTGAFQVVVPYFAPANVPISTTVDTSSDLVYLRSGQEYDAYSRFGDSHGVITLTVADTVNHKIAGTFSGVLYNKMNSADSVVVTEGAFNSPYTIQ